MDFVATTVHGGKPGWGLVVTAFGVGMALGMASANPAAGILERDRVFVSSLLAAAGALIVMAAMPNLSWTVVFTVWLGAFCGLAWVSGYTLLQENVVDEYRGRTFAALTTLSRMVLFLSLALFPLLAQVFAWIAQAPGRRRLLHRRPADRSVGHAALVVDRGRPDHRGGAQHAAVVHAVPSVASRLPRPRAETQTTTRHRSVHRLRRG